MATSASITRRCRDAQVERFRLAPRLCTSAFCVLALFISASCSSSSHVPPTPAELAKASPYAVELELSVHDETDSNSFYHVNREGTIGWGGAMQALLNETVWTGPMSNEERKQLHDLLIEHHWFDRDPVSTNEPKKRIYRATVSGVEGSNRFT